MSGAKVCSRKKVLLEAGRPGDYVGWWVAICSLPRSGNGVPIEAV